MSPLNPEIDRVFTRNEVYECIATKDILLEKFEIFSSRVILRQTCIRHSPTNPLNRITIYSLASSVLTPMSPTYLHI